jgi:hypothetical protein
MHFDLNLLVRPWIGETLAFDASRRDLGTHEVSVTKPCARVVAKVKQNLQAYRRGLLKRVWAGCRGPSRAVPGRGAAGILIRIVGTAHLSRCSRSGLIIMLSPRVNTLQAETSASRVEEYGRAVKEGLRVKSQGYLPEEIRDHGQREASITLPSLLHVEKGRSSMFCRFEARRRFRPECPLSPRLARPSCDRDNLQSPYAAHLTMRG